MNAELGGATMEGNTEVIRDDLLSPEAVADPYATLAPLREQAPVHFSDAHGAWLVSRYADVNAIFRGRELSSDRLSPWFHHKLSAADKESLRPTFDTLSRWMVFNDPPEHTRLRGLVQRAFTPKMIGELRDRIREIVDSLLDDLEGAETVDLIEQFAYPLPAIVIAEMLGVPAQDRDLFKSWSDEITSLVFGATGDDDRHDRAQVALNDLSSYFGSMLDERARSPRDDLMSALLKAEDTGDALGRDEIIATCVLLLFAGHETTTNLIANSVKALLEHPAEFRKLTDNPSLLPTAIEELLRFDGPLKVQVRSVTRDLVFRDQKLRAGERVFLIQSLANHDPRQFQDPESLDIERDNAGSHVSFGFGIHYCLGAPLARLETTVALRELMKRFPHMQLADRDYGWHPVAITRALTRLGVIV